MEPAPPPSTVHTSTLSTPASRAAPLPWHWPAGSRYQLHHWFWLQIRHQYRHLFWHQIRHQLQHWVGIGIVMINWGTCMTLLALQDPARVPRARPQQRPSLAEGGEGNNRGIQYQTQGFPCSFLPFVTLRVPPLDSETGWPGELWSKTNLLIWQN